MRPNRRSRGSVLVPVVAAMLLLSLCGGVLSELFASHRMQSVVAVDSARAHWIAEAGLAHAARVGASLATPVPYAGGSYTVVKSGTIYTSTGASAGSTRILSREFAGLGLLLDESASELTATRDNKKKFEVDLVSIADTNLVIDSFSLSSDVGNEELHRLRLQNKRIWHDHDIYLPTGSQFLNEGSNTDRTIPAGASPVLNVEFMRNQSGTVQYTLVLYFNGGASSTLTFTIDW